MCACVPKIGDHNVLSEDKKVLNNLPTSKEYVNNQEVTVLRDTGCSGAVVRKSLWEENQMTGTTCQYVSVVKTIRSAPVAEVYIQSPV